MASLRALNLSVSLDGYLAGPDQDVENPLGVGAMRLHEWVFATRTWQSTRGTGEESAAEPGERPGEALPEAGLDDGYLARGVDGIGATIMGRNMFGPVRGPWGAENWQGWWGEEPPYHHEVFVLTHHPRESFALGETTFHFVTDGIETALDRALTAAGGLDVRLGGGASAVRQYLRAGLLDELHLAVVPILLGSGERLLDDLGEAPQGYRAAEVASSPRVAHLRLVRAAGPLG